jgi:hypothetical protein
MSPLVDEFVPKSLPLAVLLQAQLVAATVRISAAMAIDKIVLSNRPGDRTGLPEMPSILELVPCIAFILP